MTLRSHPSQNTCSRTSRSSATDRRYGSSRRRGWDEIEEGTVDDAATTLSRLHLGEQFAYEFDLGDGWEHLCTVGPEQVDPAEVYGPEPDRPVPYFGWGQLPDQHGRRWGDDDGSDTPPRQPDPPTADLPPLMPGWGDRQPPALRLAH